MRERQGLTHTRRFPYENPESRRGVNKKETKQLETPTNHTTERQKSNSFTKLVHYYSSINITACIHVDRRKSCDDKV